MGTVSGDQLLGIAAVNVSSPPIQVRTALLDLDPDIFSVTTGNVHFGEVQDNVVKAYLEFPEDINPADVATDSLVLLSNGVEIAKAQIPLIVDNVLEVSFPLTPASASALLGLNVSWVGVSDRFVHVDAEMLPATTIDLLNLAVAGSLKDGDNFTSNDVMQIIQGKIEEQIISAIVEIDPETLNICSKGDKNAVTVHIEPPSEYRAQDIDISSIRMSTAAGDEPSIAAQQHPGGISYEGDALVVKFDRQEVIGLVAGVDNYAILKVRGTVAGHVFEGYDSIDIVNKK